jgi:hypothetical protein
MANDTFPASITDADDLAKNPKHTGPVHKINKLQSYNRCDVGCQSSAEVPTPLPTILCAPADD